MYPSPREELLKIQKKMKLPVLGSEGLSQNYILIF